MGSQSELAFRPSLEENRSRETSGLLQAEKHYFIGLSSPAGRLPLCRDSEGFLSLLLASLPWCRVVDPMPWGTASLAGGVREIKGARRHFLSLPPKQLLLRERSESVSVAPEVPGAKADEGRCWRLFLSPVTCPLLPAGVWIQPSRSLLRFQIRRGVRGLLPLLLHGEGPEDAPEAEGPGEAEQGLLRALLGWETAEMARVADTRESPLSRSITTGTATTALRLCRPRRTRRRGSRRSCRMGTWTT